MNPQIIMLQTDPDDRFLTESMMHELRPDLDIKYVPNLDELKTHFKEKARHSLILLNDRGTITARAQVLRQLKGDSSLKHIPVVVLGERSSPDYIEECYRAGACSFITKPSSIQGTQKKIDLFFSYWLDVAEI